MRAKRRNEGRSASLRSGWTDSNRGEPARRRVSCGRRAQRDDPFDVERSAGEHEERVDRREAAQLHLAQAGDGLEPPKRALNAGPRMLTHRVPRMSRRAAIDRAPAAARVVLRDMWRHVDLAHLA